MTGLLPGGRRHITYCLSCFCTRNVTRHNDSLCSSRLTFSLDILDIGQCRVSQVVQHEIGPVFRCFCHVVSTLVIRRCWAVMGAIMSVKARSRTLDSSRVR